MGPSDAGDQRHTGGYDGEGGKTIIPAIACANVTCRLVPNQDPYRILQRIEEHIRAHTPPGVTVTTPSGKPHGRTSPRSIIPPFSWRPQPMSRHTAHGVTSSGPAGQSLWWKHSPGCYRCR